MVKTYSELYLEARRSLMAVEDQQPYVDLITAFGMTYSYYDGDERKLLTASGSGPLDAFVTALEQTGIEHREVAMQCLRGNWAQAAQAMREHIENSKIAVLNYAVDQNRDAKNIFASAAVEVSGL